MAMKRIAAMLLASVLLLSCVGRMGAKSRTQKRQTWV